jgi:hypothetical protein
MIRYDLKAAGIEYCDASGQYFDFHSLRCETATLLDAAGVTPRVVQKIMRDSTLELTGRYTRPRAVDIDGAVAKLPSLKPSENDAEQAVMTGADGREQVLTIPISDATADATMTVAYAFKRSGGNDLRLSGRKFSNSCQVLPDRISVGSGGCAVQETFV